MKKQQTTHYFLTTLSFNVYQTTKTFLFSLFALYSPGVNCRHSPTCSVYAQTIITQYGFGRGGFLALKRLLTCHPFHFKNKKLV